MLLVAVLAGSLAVTPSTRDGPYDRSECDRLVTQAIEEVRQRGPAAADEAFGELHRQCPNSSRPLSELAGIRFSQKRWNEAEALALAATRIDATDVYAWDVLGSSRFMQDDFAAALDAWNVIGRPRLTAIEITGSSQASQTAGRALGIRADPSTVLTREVFQRAERRLTQLPTRSFSSVAYRPTADGAARLDVTLTERAMRPRGAAEWGFAAASTVINREIAVPLKLAADKGQFWELDWRWWANRPRVGLSLAGTRGGTFAGVWRFDANWESEAYRTTPAGISRESQTHIAVSLGQWATSAVRYDIKAGFDAWNASSIRAPFVSGRVERHWFADRLALGGSASRWMPLSGSNGFQTAGVRVDARSSSKTQGFVHAITGTFGVASAAAPLTLWPGAGEGRAREQLLRAHPLTTGGVITGPAFGRSLSTVTVESTRWLDRPLLPRLGFAAFADWAQAGHRLSGAGGGSSQVDVGAGVRVRLPGVDRAVRVDLARGLHDGNTALTVGTSFSIW